MTNDVKWAVKGILDAAKGCMRPRAYYDGEHRLAFAGEKFRSAFGPLFHAFADNLCPCVVETVADRLSIAGFTFPDETKEPGQETTPRPRTDLDAGARAIWRRNRMDRRAGEVHQDALVDGNAYVIVWPDAEGFPVLYPNRGGRVAIAYDDEQPGYIVRAAKAWIDETGKGRVTLYYPDRIEKWVTRSKIEEKGGLPDNDRQYVPYDEDEGGAVLQNPYKKVPVFHFGNRAGVGQLGRSELVEAMPIQDALNKSVMDMLVAMEFYALPQRWATGLEWEEEEKVRAGGLWAVAEADVKFGEFSAGDLSQFLLVAEGFRKEIARVSRTPLHYFTLDGTFPSGESQRVADAPLIAKVADRQLAWGMVWADVMRFAMEIMGAAGTDPETLWRDTQPRNEREAVEIATLKQALGVPRDQTLRELGYEQADVERFAEERATVDVLPEVAQ